MDSLGSLNTALPPNEQAEALLASSFRQAALSITALFKQGKKATSKAFIAGQRQALQEVLEFLQAILDNPDRNAGFSSGLAPLAMGGGAVGPVDVARLINFICARQEALKAEEEDRDEDEANPPSSASAAGPSYALPRRAASEAPAPPSPLRPGVAFGPRASTSTSTSSAFPPGAASAHARSYSTGMSTSSSAPASPPSSTFSPPFTRQDSIFQPHASTSASSGLPSASTFAPTLNIAPPSPSPLGPSPIPTFLSVPTTNQTAPLARPGRALRTRNSSRGTSTSGSKAASGTSTPVSTASVGAGAGVGDAEEEVVEHLGAGIKRRWVAPVAGGGPAGSVVELSPPPPEPVSAGGEEGIEVEPMADMEGWDGMGERPTKRVTRTPRHMCSSDATNFLRALPKCEHHIHIEGTLEPKMLFALAERHNITLDSSMYSTLPALEKRYRNFANLDDFLAYFNKAMDVLLDEEDFAALAFAYMQRVHADGLVHAEIFFDPQAHTGRGVALNVVVNGLKKGLKQGELEFGITTELIMCFVKHLSVESALEAVAEMKPFVEKGDVIGLGADSSEKNNPPSKFAAVYSLARELHFPRFTMHSGEEGPADWVRQTVFDLGINRVDHGFHAADDPKLLEELAHRETFLTLCPLSNVRLQVTPEGVHRSPIPVLLEKGVKFSLNSDDPAYFGGYILDNYLAVHAAFNFDKSTWRRIAQNGIDGSWCSDARKTELSERLAEVMQQWEGKEI
ncbi:adenine deaminase [Rhodotorula toruloides]